MIPLTFGTLTDDEIIAHLTVLTPEQIFKATLERCVDVFGEDGGLFAEDYFEEDDDDEAWNRYAFDFNDRMLKLLASLPLDDIEARMFLKSAFEAGVRCTLRIPFDDTFQSLIDYSAQAICYHLARAVGEDRDKEPDWGAMRGEVDIAATSRRKASLAGQAFH